MDVLTYSANPSNILNQARLQLWCAKEVLAEANRTKDNEMKGRAMGYINKDRIALRNLCYKLRAKLPAKKLYRVTLAGDAIEFVIWVREHTHGQAVNEVEFTHKGFTIRDIEELKS